MADPKETSLPAAQFFNVLRVSHNAREFFLDLGQTASQPGVADLLGRFVTTPSHLKQIAAVLTENVRKYEEKFGTIPELVAKPKEPG